MPSSAPAPCLHELRPGTKVCLHCRRAEREARAAHRNRIFTRIGVTAVAVAVAAGGVRAGLQAMERGQLPELPELMAATTKALVESLPGKPSSPAGATADSATSQLSGPAVPDTTQTAAMIAASDSTVVTGAGTPSAGQPALDSAHGPQSPAAPTALPVANPPAPASLAPTVAEGRTELTGGIFAVRAGDTVTVYFDTPEARTRRAEKFEQIVRSTLPQVHGATADAVLGSIAAGALVGSADLVNDLPTRGVHLRSTDGRAISLWPETRPGRDGPLVVAYRAVAGR